MLKPLEIYKFYDATSTEIKITNLNLTKLSTDFNRQPCYLMGDTSLLQQYNTKSMKYKQITSIEGSSDSANTTFIYQNIT